MKIGRTEVTCPYDPREIGDTYSFMFDVADFGLSNFEVLSRAEQLRGLRVGDVVPLVHDDDERLTGYYRVASSVELEPDPAYQATGYIPGRIELTRVAGGFGSALIETRAVSAVRTNAVGAGDNECNGVVQWSYNDTPSRDAPNQTTVNDTRESADGQLFVRLRFANLSHDAIADYVRPQDFYRGAATIERRWPDGVWRPVVGDHVGGGKLTGAWRVSNGLIRLSPSATTLGDLRVECWDSTAWVDMTTELRLGSLSGSGFQQDATNDGFFVGYNYVSAEVETLEPVITSNTRDLVALKFRRHEGFEQTLSLHGGDLFAEFRDVRRNAANPQAINARTTWNATGVSLGSIFASNPGLIENSDDANGNRLLLIHTDTIPSHNNTTIDGIYAASTRNENAWGIGVEIDGSSATNYNDATEICAQFIAAKARSHRVVAP